MIYTVVLRVVFETEDDPEDTLTELRAAARHVSEGAVYVDDAREATADEVRRFEE